LGFPHYGDEYKVMGLGPVREAYGYEGHARSCVAQACAHHLDKRIGVACQHEDAGTLNERLHARFGALCKRRIACTQNLIQEQNIRVDR
jgi:predicted NodU family carbamoyl transferase